MGIIVVSNQSSIPRAEIVEITPDERVFSKRESLKAWVASGEKAEDFKRPFSQIIVTDRTYEELLYLIDVDPDAMQNRYYFAEPEVGSSYHDALFNNGEVSVTFDQMLPYLRERT